MAFATMDRIPFRCKFEQYSKNENKTSARHPLGPQKFRFADSMNNNNREMLHLK